MLDKGRREFIGLLGGAAAAAAVSCFVSCFVSWPIAVRAQPQAMPVVGIISDGTPEAYAARRVAGLLRGLRESGFVEGRSVAIEYRWARGNYDLLPGLAADLVRRQVGVIVTGGSEAVTRAAQAATKAIPIVATMAGDPVKRGLVASLNRPGGNLTVVSLFTFSSNALVAKRLELLHELVPKATTVGWLADANILDYEDELNEFQSAATTLGLRARSAAVARSDELEAAFLALVRQGVGAIVEAGPNIGTSRAQLISLAAREAVPVMYEWPEFVAEGGLISYGTDLADVWRQAGVYAARILRGKSVGDLPVVQPEKYQLVINLNTARTLRLTVPLPLQASANEVIE
jgi:putative ABC transport system substrate-binding protein